MSLESVKNKTAVLFPGQGVAAAEICTYYQFLKDKNPQLTAEYINKFQKSLNSIYPSEQLEVEKILADDKSEGFLKTVFIQPLIYTLSVMTYEMSGLRADFVMGHSLGAFSALTASGALSFDKGVDLVVYRGLFMQEASNVTPSGMIAVIGLDAEKLNLLAQKTGSILALSNAPTAFVLGCERGKFESIQDEASKMGASKTIILPNSGAFHTDFMKPAYDKFNEKLDEAVIQDSVIPVVCNMTGIASVNAGELKKDISDSMINPVNWIRMMEYLKSQEVSSFVESGPGSSMSILARMNGVERDKISHAKDRIT